MLLDRIDIDAHGPLQHVELGPLAEHLNVVLAPNGSGKTAICRFVRDALVEREYPLGMFNSSTGRVVLADRHGKVHCCREQDGTAQGRRRVHFEPRGDFQADYERLENAWLRDISKVTDAGSAMAKLSIPEAVVDGIIADTSDGSVARVVSASIRSGLDAATTYQKLPLQEDSPYVDREGRHDGYGEKNYERSRRLRRQLADVEAELARHSDSDADYGQLVARRDFLNSRIAAKPVTMENESGRYALEQRSSDLQHRARNLRGRQSELRRRIADLELDIASCDHRHGAEVKSSRYRNSDYQILCRDRDSILRELDRVSASLEACLNEAADVSRSLRSHASQSRATYRTHHSDGPSHDSIKSELQSIDDRLTRLSRVQWLRTQRAQLLRQLQVNEHPVHVASPLAEAASHWLVRLSGSRLRRLTWAGNRFDDDRRSYHRDAYRVTGVSIDDRDEARCSASDRVLAALAVRMAAADIMARTGRHVPLVVEIPGEVLERCDITNEYDRSSHAYREHGDHLRSNHPLAAALRDYAHSGRQVLVLTSSSALAQQLGRVGGRGFEIQSQRVAHPHRPMWQPQYRGEVYVGPHPHTYGDRDAVHLHRAEQPATRSNTVADVNRDLDVAWQESQDARHPTSGSRVNDSSHHTDWAIDGVDHRDGFFYADRYTTEPGHVAAQLASNFHVNGETTTASSQQKPEQEGKTVHEAGAISAGRQSPFYLSVDSPIDQAPSVDAVAAARLRGLKVTHVTHLMQRDPNRLSDALGLASVDASTIRRWQAECRLACRVPNLRGFDARVLVGCGVTTPGQLSSIHPTDLLHDVEAFLATEQGQQMLLSGTSQELSRIMTWIATANSVSDRKRLDLQGTVPRRRVIRTMNERDALLNTGHPLDVERSTVAAERRDRSRKNRKSNRQRRRKTAVVVKESRPQVTELKFYLHREAPVVDAPSIGPRMAERLEGVGVTTVDELLSADPETVAVELDHERIDADTIILWQQQTTLVCRVPMLRGHDAQLLVASGITSPEELAETNADELFEIVDVIARSSEGKRILRGGRLPDLQEVRGWIHYAGYQRELRAA